MTCDDGAFPTFLATFHAAMTPGLSVRVFFSNASKRLSSFIARFNVSSYSAAELDLALGDPREKARNIRLCAMFSASEFDRRH